MDLLNYTGVSLKELSPLALAYIGDCVFEIMVRTALISKHNEGANALHKRSKNIVNAKAQAKMYFRIKDKLTESEQAVFRRGRNTKSATVPKNADLTDYRNATGLEALFGYLYLNGETDRLKELFFEGVIL